MTSSEHSQISVKLESPFLDQKPGTSGLRKSTKYFFDTPHYLESFLESTFKCLPGVEGGILIVGGDGRYGNSEAIQLIISMAAVHGVSQIITTTNGILSTPAASHLIRFHKAVGGIILSASHNPGGINGDFGVKINGSNGGPASESLTEKIYNYSCNLVEYKISKEYQPVPLNHEGVYNIGSMKISVINGIEDYSSLMQKLFDFDLISSYIKNNFTFSFDSLNAVTGPYAKLIFEDLLGAPQGTVKNGQPLEDFGGCHPDPNLTYAHQLADELLKEQKYSFGAACDGDGDRNMILGKGCFVNPSDSLAVLTANYSCVPEYSNGLFGVARSMPTSSAVDVVAKSLKIKHFETPTGWKFFGNLLDKEMITFCGEESFGTGSSHIREKDGIWAVLFWLQILSNKKCSVSNIMNSHWSTFGRHYYSRHDYESIPSDIAKKLYSDLESKFINLKGNRFAGRLIESADNFRYCDPIDNSVAENQGLRIILDDQSRVVLRLSGTGTKGATLRVYLEKYVSSTGNISEDPQLALSDLIKEVDNLAQITKLTKMLKPSVIT